MFVNKNFKIFGLLTILVAIVTMAVYDGTHMHSKSSDLVGVVQIIDEEIEIIYTDIF